MIVFSHPAVTALLTQLFHLFISLLFVSSTTSTSLLLLLSHFRPEEALTDQEEDDQSPDPAILDESDSESSVCSHVDILAMEE